MKPKTIIFLAVALLFLGCDDDGDTDDDGPYLPEGYAYLENQEEHSGIAVEILEADTFVLTDSTGYYNLSFLPDGEYTLNCVFPYYKNESIEITISDGMVTERISEIELKQILEYQFEMEDTIFYNGDIINLSANAINISDDSLLISWSYYEACACLIFYDSIIFDCLPHGIFPGGINYYLMPDDTFPVGGCWDITDTIPTGLYTIICGVLTTDIFNEIAPYTIYFPSYYPEMIDEKVYNKLPHKNIIIEETIK